MSVVNKMLQDLEARQADGEKISADYQPPAKRPKWLWLLAFLLIVSALLAYWLLSREPSSLVRPKVIAELNQTQPPAPVVKTMLVAEHKTPAFADAETSTGIAQQNPEHGLESEQKSAPQQNILPVSESADLIPPEQTTEQPADPQDSLPTATVPAATELGSFQMTGSSQASQTASVKQQIKDALADDNNALAMTLLNQLLEQEPDNIEALKKLAALLFANGNVLKATNLLQLSVQTAPARSDIRLMLARLYVQQNEPDAALTVLKESQPAQYMEIDYLAYRANLAQQLADYTGAKQDYTALTQVDVNNARWWLGLAITEEKLGADKIALNCYYHAQNLAQLEPAVTEFIKQRINLLAGKP